MSVQFAPGHETLGAIHEALGLPQDMPICGFQLDCDIHSVATAEVKFRLTKDMSDKLGVLLGRYRLEPIETEFADDAGFLHKGNTSR